MGLHIYAKKKISEVQGPEERDRLSEDNVREVKKERERDWKRVTPEKGY